MPSEIVIAHPPPGKRAEPVKRVRSTIIAGGLAALRANGHFDSYAAALDGESREALLATVAGAWLPVDLALAHYRACDALQLSHADMLAIGLTVGSRAHDSLLLGLKQLASAAGVTPWTLVSQYDRLWARTFDGGGFRILRVGPKDGVIELNQVPLAASPYFRSAFCGVNLSGLNLVTRKAFVRLQPGSGALSFSMRASWV
ncbi:MAG TPA: hypothetical protein VGI39_46495 [Polyangiaceae bacterium]|jgi:hypothetical protein